MKRIAVLCTAAVLAASLCACGTQQQSGSSSSTGSNTATVSESDASQSTRETIYQVALLQSLTQGYYDGIISVDELKKHGDIGIGTFEGVNGEMIVLDGVVYQALGDGKVVEADSKETVPFSNVTYFDEDGKIELSDISDLNTLKKKLDDVVTEQGKNSFYFIKLSGTFNTMNVRSELKQEKPYRTLDKALETDQREFTYDNIKGTVVALYCPDYMDGLNTPGWHFHFISEDFSKGGHVLDLNIKTATALYDKTEGFDMKLSDNSDFQKMDLAKDVSGAIKKVETNEEAETQSGEQTAEESVGEDEQVADE